MRRVLVVAFLLSLLAATSSAKPPAADQIVQAARTKALRESKNVLLIFSASWCSWCRRFDSLFHQGRFADEFRSSYVIRKITVREREDKAKLVNPGWETLMKKFRQSAAIDVPYLVVLSPRGKVLARSYQPSAGKIPDNGGYPSKPAEIDAFLRMLKSTGRAFSQEDLQALSWKLKKEGSGVK